MALTTPDDEYRIYLDKWKKTRSLMKGKEELIKEVTSIPRPQYTQYTSGLSDRPDYAEFARKKNRINYNRAIEYWNRGVLFPAYSRTVTAFDGMVCSKEPEYNLIPRLAFIEDNITGDGKGIREVSQRIIRELLITSRYAILVDMPEMTEQPTIADMEQRANLPKWIQYDAEQIFYTRTSGKTRGYDEVRLTEVHSKPTNDFDWEDLTHTRRLIIKDGVYVNELYDENDDLISSVTPKMNGMFMDYIPIQPFGCEQNTFEYEIPCLYDLAGENIGHFVLDCDNRDNLHHHAQGMTNVYVRDTDAFEEANPAGLDGGPKGINQFGVDERVEILQIQATGAIPSEMLRDEQRLIMSGAQMVTENSSNMTLGAKRIDSNANTSALSKMSYNISAGLKNLIDITAGFLNVDSSDSHYKLNTDFITDDMTPEMINAHMAMVMGNKLPDSTLYETARKAKFTDLDDEEIEKALNDQNLLAGGTTEELAAEQAIRDAENIDE